jgi:hypothetical protein
MNDLSFPTKPKWVKGAKSSQVNFLPKATNELNNPSEASGALAITPFVSSASTLKFGAHFPEEYFLGSHKSEFIASLAGSTSCASHGYRAFCELCESLPLTSSDRALCLTVLEALFNINSNWFLMPTSSTGKYHGGMLSAQNTIGGIYQHSLALCKLATPVLKRYQEVIESLTGSDSLVSVPGAIASSFDFPSQLLSCCILHDIGKMNLSQDTIYSVANHGEVAAEFIAGLGLRLGASSALLYAVSNHMYGWKAINVFNHIVSQGASMELVLLFMLCECDFFGSQG